MATTKVAITVDQQLLKLIDRWVSQGRYPNRSQAIQAAVREKVDRWGRIRLWEEVAKLNPKEERGLAEESFAGEAWPEY